jgi:hypothetical protein
VRLPGHCSGEQLDAVDVAEVLLVSRSSLGSLLAALVVLGQRRPLVGRGGLIAHQHMTLESLTAQSLDSLGSREACFPSRTLTSRTPLAPLLVWRQLGRAGPASCPRSRQHRPHLYLPAQAS